ncbi:N-acetyltransferase family protein [Bacillus sp. AK031]
MENILKNAAPGQHDFVAVTEGKVIGFAGMHQGKGRRSHSGTLFIMVHEDYHGKGAGSALIARLLDLADYWLMLERVEFDSAGDQAKKFLNGLVLKMKAFPGQPSSKPEGMQVNSGWPGSGRE